MEKDTKKWYNYTMREYLNLLNPKQLEACMDTKGPSLIVAGAGSGKTRVLTSRIAYLIEHDGVDPENILAITFTNKAAKEMQDRVEDILGSKYNGVTCKTFHSFCNYILRREIEVFEGRKNSFEIIDEDQARSLVRESMVNLGYDTKILDPGKMLDYISLVKSGIKAFSDFESYIKEKIENIYNEYNKNLIRYNLLDFDDLLLLTVELFEEHNDILNKYQEKFKYILVDEFQDSSNIQYDLIEMLASKYENIFIVGDEDQSIYSFRGANIENIRKFMRRFKGYHEHILDENYRSTQNILDCANKLISNNEDRIKKNLWTSKGAGNDVSLNVFDTDKIEVAQIIKTIKVLVSEKGYSYGDFAIIYRNNYLSRNFEDRLLFERIPYRVYSGMSFYKREEVNDILAYIRLVVNPNDFYSLKRALLRPKRGIGETSINKIDKLLYETDGDVIKAIQMADIGFKQKEDLINLFNTLSDIKESLNKVTIKEFFDMLYERSGYKKMISEMDDEDKKESKSQNIQELLNAMVSLESLDSNEETIIDFLNTVSLLSELDINTSDDNHVKLITMHSAKGLEFRCVFACGLEDDIIPGLRCLRSSEFEEERRILYVCLTRAMERLYISCSKERYKFGKVSMSRHSRFLDELGLELKTKNSNGPQIRQSSPGALTKVKDDTPKGDIKVGERVYHEMFKEGTVMGEVSGYYIIKFDNSPSPKKVIVNHPLLKKL